MAIQAQLQEDLKTAMRARDQQRLDTLRMLLAALKNARIERGDELDEPAVISILQKEARRRRESAVEYRRLGRADLADSEEAEQAIIDAYLPTLLTSEQLTPLVAAVIAETGAQGLGDLAKVMPVLMSRFKGQAEGRTINEVARTLLSA